eukprot:m51a1_g12170 hypothetical protein (476) ;mRNA; r:487-2504
MERDDAAAPAVAHTPQWDALADGAELFEPPAPPDRLPSLVVTPNPILFYVSAEWAQSNGVKEDELRQALAEARCYREGDITDDGRLSACANGSSGGTVLCYVFDACRAGCSSSRLHLKCRLVLAVRLPRTGQRVCSDPFVFMAREKASRAPRGGLAGAGAFGGESEEEDVPPAFSSAESSLEKSDGSAEAHRRAAAAAPQAFEPQQAQQQQQQQQQQPPAKRQRTSPESGDWPPEQSETPAADDCAPCEQAQTSGAEQASRPFQSWSTADPPRRKPRPQPPPQQPQQQQQQPEATQGFVQQKLEEIAAAAGAGALPLSQAALQMSALQQQMNMQNQALAQALFNPLGVGALLCGECRKKLTTMLLQQIPQVMQLPVQSMLFGGQGPATAGVAGMAAGLSGLAPDLAGMHGMAQLAQLAGLGGVGGLQGLNLSQLTAAPQMSQLAQQLLSATSNDYLVQQLQQQLVQQQMQAACWR